MRRPVDDVWFGPGDRLWDGATADHEMTYVAAHEADGATRTWRRYGDPGVRARNTAFRQSRDTRRHSPSANRATRAFLDPSGTDTERLMVDGVSADPQIVADEMVCIIAQPRGQRPRRAVADGLDCGAEIINGAVEQLRMRLARRTGHLAPHGSGSDVVSAEQLPRAAQQFIDATNAENGDAVVHNRITVHDVNRALHDERHG